MICRTCSTVSIGKLVSSSHSTGSSPVASTPLQTTYGFLGSGVQVDSIKRVRNASVDEQTMNLNSDLNEATVQQQSMSNVESIFNGDPRQRLVRSVE